MHCVFVTSNKLDWVEHQTNGMVLIMSQLICCISEHYEWKIYSGKHLSSRFYKSLTDSAVSGGLVEQPLLSQWLKICQNP